MSIWEDYFRAIFRFDVLSFLLGTLLAVAGILIVFDLFAPAAICFGLSGLLLTVRTIYGAQKSSDTIRNRTIFALVVGLLLVGLTTAAILGTLRYGDKKANAETAKDSQVRWTDLEVGPAQPGLPIQVNLTYENFGSGGIKLNFRYAVRLWTSPVAVSQLPVSGIEELEEEYWHRFENAANTKEEFSSAHILKLSPYQAEWSTLTGVEPLSEYQSENLNLITKKVAVIITGRFLWRDEDSDKTHIYDFCMVSQGDPKVIFKCTNHNGPISSKK